MVTDIIKQLIKTYEEEQRKVEEQIKDLQIYSVEVNRTLLELRTLK